MRVLYTIHSVNPANGGPIEFVRQMIPLHKEFGDQIAVVSMDNPSQSFVKDFPGTLFALGPGMTDYGFSPLYLPWLKKESKNYDIVIINGLWQYPSFGTWLALRNTRIPYVIFPHGMLDPWFKTLYIKHLKKLLYWKLAESMVLRDAKGVVFTSEAECANARQTFRPYRCQEIVSGLGIAMPAGEPIAQQSLFLNRYPELEGKEIVLFLGRIHPKKGCDLLLEAFAKLASEHAKLHLVMAGPADDADYVCRLKEKQSARQAVLEKHVTWTGMLSGDLKWGALHSAEALILPSHQENFAVVVSESLACGKPVLISNKVNIWPDIVATGAGLVEPDTLEGTEQLLKDWLGLSHDERLEMQLRAKQCFLAHYEVHGAYERLRAVLEQAVAEAKHVQTKG